MYIDKIPNRNSKPCILLRESYRVGKQVKKRTITNLSNWPPSLVEDLDTLLHGGAAIESLPECFKIQRSLPHGHVAAVLGTVRRLNLDKMIASQPCPERDRVIAMIVSRLLEPQPKLALARSLNPKTQTSSLGDLLDLNDIHENDLYSAMDWLFQRQESIEKKLAKKHLQDGVMVLYDLTSTYFEGQSCPLAQFGYSRDGKKDKRQIVFGLLCTLEGLPIAVEVFEGNTSDSKTLSSQINKVRKTFGIDRVIFVGDRGMITQARIQEELQQVEGVDWITALTAVQVKKLLNDDTLQPSLFDEQDLAEIQSPAYPGERLVACRNPLLAAERKRKREELLQATEKELEKIVAATQRARRPLQGKDKIALRVGKVFGRFKVGKHFNLTVEETQFSYQRNAEKIWQEESLDGIYIIRSNVPSPPLSAEGLVKTYKELSVVERAFRCMKTVDLHVRPIHHRLSDRVRAHIFLCMLSYHVEWHMRKSLAPLLFEDDQPEEGEVLRESIVAPSQRSPEAIRKAQSQRTAADEPVHSFNTLLNDLATICKQQCQPNHPEMPFFEKTTVPTPLQQRAFDLLKIRLECVQ
ncbi:IS1634 family transposase [bacterium]|nr:IS1634 family transposase [bacterium]